MTARRCAALAGAVSLLLAAAPGAAGAAAAGDCAASPDSNGTGYRPPANAASLPTGSPPPGPEMLHRPLASSPQLENTGVWRAEPIMVSGARAYRKGEFVYQDFLYDDRALPYPDDPERYGGNAADIVEVRLKPLAHATAVRITYNTMLDPQVLAATIALGESSTPRPAPHDAGAVMPAEVFVTVHGCSADVVRAADGARLPERPHVTVDPRRRQLHVEVPYAAFDPRGDGSVRVATATGLWDVFAERYHRPDRARPAFFNVAFREYGPWTQNTWMDESQNAALTKGDLSPLYATVDFRKLAAGVDDDMPGKPGGVPRSGPMNRILVSHFEYVQGRGANSAGGGVSGDFTCDPPGCTHQFSGRLQPYSVYVPREKPSAGYGLVINLHGANSNHNHFEGGGPTPVLRTWQMLAEAGHPSIMAMPNARGMSYFYHGLAAADVFEMWADVAGHYDLDPGYVIQSGSSMGGYGTYKLGTQFPDLYRGLFPNVGPSAAVVAHSPPAPAVSGAAFDVWRMFAALRNVPVLSTQNAHDAAVPVASTAHSMRTLDGLGYRYDYWYFTGEATSAGHAEYRHFVDDRYSDFSRDLGPVVRDPRRVTYVLNDHLSDARHGLTADHAYWVSGLELHDRQASPPLGTVDVVSQAIRGGEPAAAPAERSAGPAVSGSGPYTRVTRRWDPPSRMEAADAFRLTASNVAAATLDVARMQLPEFGSFSGRIETDAELSLRFAGAFGGATRAMLDGKERPIHADGSAATVAIPAGTTTLRVWQPSPIALPPRRPCAGARSLRIRLRAPRGDRLRSARVYVNGKRVRVLRGRRLRGRIALRNLPAGVVRVKVVALTRRGRRLVTKRTYRPCPARARRSR